MHKFSEIYFALEYKINYVRYVVIQKIIKIPIYETTRNKKEF